MARKTVLAESSRREGKSFMAALIGKIHVARKQLGLSDDSYRAMLTGVTGKDSCANMAENELKAVLKRFEELGFKPTGGKRAGSRKPADSNQAKMIRALWLDLYHLGALRDPTEDALAAFVKRTTKVPALQWLGSGGADDVIKALRGWLERTGFSAPNAPVVRWVAARRAELLAAGLDEDTAAIAWKVCIILRQVQIIGGFLDEDFSTFDPLGLSEADLNNQIERFGATIRANKWPHN